MRKSKFEEEVAGTEGTYKRQESEKKIEERRI